MKIKDFAKLYKKQIFAVVILSLILAFSAAVYFIAARPLIAFINDPVMFKNFVDSDTIKRIEMISSYNRSTI